MSKKSTGKYRVRLSQEEREYLLSLLNKAKVSGQKQTHARVLLQSDCGEYGEHKKDPKIVESLHVSFSTVGRIRQRFVEEGMESALNRKRHSKSRSSKLNGDSEAHLIALCCSEAPEGKSRWTLSLLADKLVELKIVDEVSATTVGRVLKKTNLNLG